MRTADFYLQRGLLSLKSRDYDAAARDLAEALKLDPKMVEAWVVRGNIRVAQGQPFDALLHFDCALDLKPNAHDIWNNRGLAFADLGNWANAEVSFKKSAEALDAIEPHMNLANLYAGLMRLEDAVVEYRRAIEFEPGNYEAHLNLGVTLLGLGQWEEGFKEYYWRHKGNPYPPEWARHGQPWQGEDLNGHSITLWPEQGYGDEILFNRVWWWLKEKYPQARIERGNRAPLTDLFGGDVKPHLSHFQCSTIDVIGFMGITPWTVPQFLPYVRGEATPITGLVGKRLKVGLCWESGQRPLQPDTAATSANKSISLPLFANLITDNPQIDWVSLQKEHRDQRMVRNLGLIDPMESVHSFQDTADLIAGLDLVISVDTAVAHVAGGMGKPVWNLVRYAGYWPWLHPDVFGPEHAIWYPSMRLYRQPRLFDWVVPVAKITEDLQEFIERKEAA